MISRTIDAIDELQATLEAVGIQEESGLLGMHLAEIEEELGNIFELLTTLRVRARCNLVAEGQDALVELTTSLEHLTHHAQEAIPMLNKQLDLEDDLEEWDETES